MKKLNRNLSIVKHDVTPDLILKLDAGEAQSAFNSLAPEDKIGVVLSAPWIKRQQLIMLDENPTKLVQALPEDEIYWTIKEIGADDALPIISRLSFDQLQYSIDIDCWIKDLIDMAGVSHWLRMLLRCREENVLEWVTRTDERFLNFAFKKLFNVFRLSDDLDQTEASDLLPSWTIDGLYYFQFADDEARQIAIPFLHLLYKTDSSYFYYLMENTKWVSAVELEEDALRMRQRRMAEQGFPELEEAWPVYQYLSAEEMQAILDKKKHEGHSAAASPSQLPRLRYRFTQSKRNLFVHAVLHRIDDRQIAERVQREIISLTNKIMIADCTAARETGDKERAFGKVMGYINISLELLSKQDLDTAVRLMGEVPIHFLFRAGYSQALTLQNSARRFYALLQDRYPKLQPEFYGPPWGETIAGLRSARPLFFEGNLVKESSTCREFETLEEIRVTERVLDVAAMITKVLFDCFGLQGSGVMNAVVAESTLVDTGELRAQQLFLTVLAHHVLYGKTEPAPITVAELQKFLPRVFTASAKKGAVSATLTESLLPDTMNWLRLQYRLAEDTMPCLQAFVRNCFEVLEQECGALADARDIDTRYISAFLFRK